MEGWPPVGADAYSCDQKGPYSKNQCKKVSTHARSSVYARPKVGRYDPSGIHTRRDVK